MRQAQFYAIIKPQRRQQFKIFQFKEGNNSKLEPITEAEHNFPIAFSILVYHSFEQIEQLLLAIYKKQNFYCLHVDKKVKHTFLKKVSKHDRNIDGASKRLT